MSGTADHSEQTEALRDRIERFRDAAFRINESLDLDAVLQSVLDSARELTGGRYALISLIDRHGMLTDCLTSGLTAEEADEFLNRMPNRWEFYDFLTRVDEPQRVDDLQTHLTDHGLPEFRPPFEMSDAMASLAVPIRHAGERSGVIYVTEKAGGFSTDDEETLSVFASLAAMAISNAHRFEGEQRARADLEGLVATTPMIMVMFDAATGAVTSLNRDAKRLLGDLGMSLQSVDELVEAATYRRADGREVTADDLSRDGVPRWGEEVRGHEVTAEFPDGRIVALIVNATPIKGADGKVESVVVAAQDMTPLLEMERLRSEFLGMIGHELGTPLAAVKGSATTLLQGKSTLDPAEMAQFFRIIDDQADRMRELLSDLIDMVRIETGTLEVDPQPAVLARLVEQARDTFVGTGGRENIVMDFPADLPAVMADGRRIVQVINNLLTNASRHSHQGSPIRVEAAVDSNHVTVSVVDRGHGVAAERIPHLFAKFSRTPGPDYGRDLGLGLAICKGIVEAHGGRIWAESDGPGLGSRFVFTLPLSHAAAAAATPAPQGASHAADVPIRVLAVDDDPRALKRVRDSLTDEGYHTTVTGDPYQVAALIAEAAPHVVLLDVMLPDTTGIELMHEIFALCDAPVIFLSAYSREDLIAQALEAGASDYIIKPFSPTELAARIKAALRARRPRPTAASAAGRPSGPEPETRFELGELRIDHAARLVHMAGQPVVLAPVEYRLLAELAANAGTLLSHDHLADAVWGTGNTPGPNRIRTIVKDLRKKLGDDARNPRYIFTAPRVGYRMPSPGP